MNNSEINKALHGVISKDCWHIPMELNSKECVKCGDRVNGESILIMNPNYFSKEGFWDAYDYARKQDWWYLFEQRHDCIADRRFFAVDLAAIHYTEFALNLYNFLVAEKIIK